MTYRILIFNDSKYRDLPGNALLKKSLESALPDSFVQICSFHLWKEAIELFCPHLVILNHVQGKRNNIIASYVKRHGGIVVVAFTEGIIEFDDKIKIFKAQKSNKNVDAFLCWNDEVANLVDGTVTGCPRFDIYNNRQDLIDSKELFCDKWGIDSSKKIVLFGDSWPSAKFTYSMQSFHRENWSELGNTKADKWSDADEFAHTQRMYQEKFKDIIRVLSYDTPAQLVVKSHPMSDYLMWAKWSGETGIPVIHSEYSFNALNACDIYITKLGSITVAEAWLLTKPVIKIITDMDTSSSNEQKEADILNAHLNADLIDIMIGDLFRADFSSAKLDQPHLDYLKKWGIGKKNATESVTNQLISILESTDFNLRYQPDYAAFFNALHKHDLTYSSNILDGFGNWNKTTLQKDVTAWNV